MVYTINSVTLSPKFCILEIVVTLEDIIGGDDE